GKDDRAEAAFIEAWRRGSQEAEERLKALYKEKRGNLQGYDEYLLGKGRGDNNSGSSFKLPAPEFRGVSLDGRTFDSKSLQGKIVVVNMWFIACGPCRKEIPKLNHMVRELKGKRRGLHRPHAGQARTAARIFEDAAVRVQHHPRSRQDHRTVQRRPFPDTRRD